MAKLIGKKVYPLIRRTKPVVDAELARKLAATNRHEANLANAKTLLGEANVVEDTSCGYSSVHFQYKGVKEEIRPGTTTVRMEIPFDKLVDVIDFLTFDEQEGDAGEVETATVGTLVNA